MERRRAAPDVFDQRRIFEAPSVRISRWRCRQSRPGPGSERYQPAPLIVFLHSGNFRVHSSADIGLLDCTRVGFFNKDVPFRSAHPYSGGDAGAEFAFRADVLADVFGAPAADRPDHPFPIGWGPLGHDAFLLQSVILRKCGPAGADELEVEELSLRLAARVAGSASAANAGRPERSGSRDREQAEALRGVLSRRPGARHRLDDLASRFGSTPFRLCRTFRAATGTTIHRYLTAVRLHRAIDRLADGCRDLADLAFGLGFSSHSHFTATFRRSLGTTPDRIRALAAGGGLPALRARLPASSARLDGATAPARN